MIVFVLSLIISYVPEENELLNAQNEFDSIIAYVDNVLPSLMRAELLTSTLIDDVEVKIKTSIELQKSHDFFYWTERCMVIFYVDDVFDELNDEQKYELLDSYGRSVWGVKSEIIRENVPKHNLYSNFMSEENDMLKARYGKPVFSYDEYEIFFQTSRNTYEYVKNIDHFFLKNGTECWIRDTGGESDILFPYEGMSVEMIDMTALGKPTRVEKCRDFDKLDKEHRSTVYTWYENGIQDLQHLQAIATVRYWDQKSNKSVKGYVSSVTIYN